MAYLNSNLSDINIEHASGTPLTSRSYGADGEEARPSKPADVVYRIAAMVGGLILLYTVVWAG